MLTIFIEYVSMLTLISTKHKYSWPMGMLLIVQAFGHNPN